MKGKDVEEFLKVLYPFLKEKLINDGFLKNYVQRKNANVVAVSDEINTGKRVKVVLPMENKDKSSFYVRNETGHNLIINDLVVLEYSIDIKNAIAVYKV